MRENPDLEEAMAGQGYITIPEAAARTKLARSTIYDAERADKIKSIKTGHRTFIEITSFLAWAGEGARLLWDATVTEKPTEASDGSKEQDQETCR